MQEEQKNSTITDASRQKTILLIEDSPIFGKILARAIAQFTPYHVIHLGDGSHILQTLSENKPHLLVLDYDLPGMNGIEIYDLVHATKGWEDLPAIMVSAGLPYQEIEQRKIPGLAKPCSTSEFVRVIEEAIG